MTPIEATRLNRYHAEHIDTEAPGDNPAWDEAADQDIRTEMRGCITGAALGLATIALIAPAPSIIAFVGGLL